MPGHLIDTFCDCGFECDLSPGSTIRAIVIDHTRLTLAI